MSQLQPSLLQNVTPLRSRKVTGTCSRCGQKLPRAFGHVLNIGLVSFLWSLYHAGTPTKLVDLPIDKCTFANAQKVAYFNLARSDNGKWNLTERGLLFLGNRIEVERKVWTRQGKVVERDAKLIRVSDVDEGWSTKLDYAREARSA